MKRKLEFNFKGYYEYCLENGLKPGFFSSLQAFKNSCGG